MVRLGATSAQGCRVENPAISSPTESLKIGKLIAFDWLKAWQQATPEPEATPEAITGKQGQHEWNSILKARTPHMNV
jgi:hypothetical protein